MIRESIMLKILLSRRIISFQGFHNVFLHLLKGIVSRDWAELEMISLDRSEVFNISASRFLLFSLPFSYSIFKNGCLSGASFQHSSSIDHYSSGDSNSLADSQKVMRRMLPRDRRNSLAS